MKPVELDKIPTDLSESVTLANKMIQRSYLLAARIAIFQESQPDSPLPYDIHSEIETLNEGIEDVAHLDITFSGIGCVPTLMPDGEMDSIYSKVDFYVGNLHSFDLTDATDLANINADDLDEFVEEEGSLFIDDERIEQLRKQLVIPQRGIRLFTELFLESTGPEQIAGASIRTLNVENYAIIDSKTLKVTSMDIYEEPGCYDSNELTEGLVNAASIMHNLLMDTKFRRQSRRKQSWLLENQLEQLNKKLAIDRFALVVKPEEVYAPDTSHENYRMIRIHIPSHVSTFTAQCLRIDSLEYFTLTNLSQRITRSRVMRDPSASFCLVAEIDEDTRQQIGAPTNIIWLPVHPLSRSGRSKQSYIDPIFDAIFIE